MNCEWEDFIWGDLATLEYGKSLRNYKNSTGKYPVFGTNGQIGYCDKPLVNEEGVIIGRKGAYRGVHYSKDPFFVIDTAFYLKPLDSNSLDIKFAYYQLLTLDINSLDSGSAIPSTSREDFYSLPIKLPSINEQHEIVNLLKSFDDKIELNRQMNITLEQMAQAIFKHWFIDFEFPDENGQPYRSSGGEMVDSELGEIPAGWEVKILSDLCEYIMSGGTPRTKVPEYWDGDIPWLSSGETRNRFIINTEKSISKIGVENSSTRLARSGSTVIASAGQGHTRGQTSLLLLDTYVNQSVVSLAADTKLISDFYLFFNLARRYDEMRRISDSHSSRGSLTTKLLGNLKVTCPPIDLIRRFDQIAEPIVNQIHYNLEQADTLSQFRDSLLPKLMSGKIRVKQ